MPESGFGNLIKEHWQCKPECEMSPQQRNKATKIIYSKYLISVRV